MLSAIIGLIVAHIMKPGADFAVSQIVDTGEVIKPAEPMTVSQTILSMVPDNPITALATGNLMQIIVFGVFIGIAITILGDKVKNVKKVIDEANIIMFNATSYVYLYDYIDFHRYSWYSKQWHCIDYNVTYNNGASY